MAYPKIKTVTVASGQQTSNAFNVGAGVVSGLLLPSSLTSTAITFTAADSQDGTYKAVYDSDGNQVSFTVAASRAVGAAGSEIDALAPFEWFKLVCGSAEGGDRTIQVIVK
jgi:hypothetical protein